MQVQRYYVWAPDGRLLYLIDATQGNAVSYFHFDQIGSTLALTGANGDVSDAYAYTPYGVLLSHSGSSTQPFTYIGESGVRSEAAASLYDMRARYYDPVSARFLSPDPMWPRPTQPASLNPYQYSLRNPTLYSDPLGLCETGNSATVRGVKMALSGARAGVNYFGNLAQTGAELANGEAGRLADGLGNEMLNWTEGFMNGTVAEESGVGDLVYTAYEQDEAVNLVNFMYGGTPGNPLAEGEGLAGIFTPQAELQAKRWYYANTTSEITGLEEEAASLSSKAKILKGVGTGLAVAGVALQTGVAAYEDYNNGAGVAATLNDAGSTALANGLVLAAPPVALVDGLTGGTVSGLVGNAIKTPGVVTQIAVGRVTTRDAGCIQRMYTRFAVGRWLWSVLGD
jgi:RHS repeat-associated protein